MPAFWPRAIMHVDMDAFFAAIEQHDNPSLRGKPVIVGGTRESRGVVSAASYEARAFGVHSAMPAVTARQRCPQGIFLPVRMERYCEVSKEIHEIFTHYTPAVQPLSVDEAFLDITGSQRLLGDPLAIARAIKEEIRTATGLTASVGVAPTCFVAKIASDMEKPDGLVLIPEDEVLARLAPLPVERMWGVGKVTAKHMHRLGIHTIQDLRNWPTDTLEKQFGSGGAHLYQLARGIDPRKVEGNDPEKSVSNETTFAYDIDEMETLEHALKQLSDKVAARLRKGHWAGKTVQIRVRYDDFSTITRRTTLPSAICTGRELFQIAQQLLHQRTDAGARPVRLIGVGVSQLQETTERQGNLFSPTGDTNPGKFETLEFLTDQIRQKFGRESIERGSLLPPPDKKTEAEDSS